MSQQSLLQRRYRLLGEKAPLFYDKPIHIVRGQGVWLEGADGRRYLDVYNNVPNVGHCHPHVVEAMVKQAATLNVHTRYLHETILEYGEKLTSTLDDSLSMLFLTCTGSEANEVAIRVARSYTGKMGIIVTNATYHGNTSAVYELATLFDAGGANVKAVDFPCTYRPLNDLSGDVLTDAYANQVKKAIEAFEAEGVGFAGMLICPIFANEGLPNVPQGYMDKIVGYVREVGGIFIADEVQSAFGRSGKMWGHEYAGVIPDIITLGKPMGNGYPLAGTICRPELGKAFRDQVMYFNTYGGNPVACAAGLAVLEVIDRENLVVNSREVGAYLRKGLKMLADKYDLIGDIRGCGLYTGVELVTDRKTKMPAAAQTSRLVNLMKAQGVLLSKIGLHGNILKMRPPICFSYKNADLLLENLDQAFSRL